MRKYCLYCKYYYTIDKKQYVKFMIDFFCFVIHLTEIVKKKF